MQPHYYIMKNKKILRLEKEVSFSSLPHWVQETILEDGVSLNQGQANWRVAIFRDEIMEYDEYVEWLSTQECETELIAN